MKELTFYFDYLSPFSYFAWAALQKIKAEKNLLIHYKPVALGPLLNHWQIKGPGEIQPKREFLLKQCLRFSAKNKIPFTTPATHPFNSLYALRLSLKKVALDDQEKVIEALWKAGWQDRIDMGEPDALLEALRAAKLHAEVLYELSFTKEAKIELKANIQEAISQGVFGVPSFVVENEVFWGNDSLDDVVRFLEGSDPLDRDKLQDLLASTPRAASQQI